jgi:ubiquitin C-terminal hydrolase
MSRKCEKCGVEDTKAKAQILKLPHVLVLQLKRLHMDRDIPCTKVSAPVKFTSRLDIGTDSNNLPVISAAHNYYILVCILFEVRFHRLFQ